METIVLTFEKKETIKGNIFDTLNSDKQADDFARKRASKINNTIFTKTNDLIFKYAQNIANKISIENVEVSLHSTSHGEIYIYFHTKDYRGCSYELTHTKLSAMYTNSSREKYPIYSTAFSISVYNKYTIKIGDTRSTDSLEKVEERILGDLKLALKL